ncbi:TlpA family protein disulfide reductase [Cupriavidus sp. CuC1]|uniref:TlpA family protein disulfide reductase n=1 Tax=Cupriavidus sp. CuC1 TaxID=3373131 RepID=UPI0037D73A7E
MNAATESRREKPTVPTIQLYDAGGLPYKLKATGRPLIANLWATWCPPCRIEMPIFANVQ